MVFPIRRISAMGFFILFSGCCIAQKNITIPDSLSAHSDMRKVKLGSQGPGKMWKMSFGDYTVFSSKKGWTAGGARSNFFNTKTESKTTDKFSFLLTNKLNDTARVNAANNILIKTLQEIEIIPGFSWGENELLLKSRNFSAYININHDTSETWALLMHVARVHDSTATYEAFNTNGARRIFI